MNSKRKRTKKKSGISRRAILLGAAAGALGAAAEAPYALIVGTVYRESGHSLGGAEVELIPAQPDKRWKKQNARSNGRGEFAFRVPAAPMEFDLKVKADAYRPESKRVKITGDERIDLSFLLDRLPKEK